MSDQVLLEWQTFDFWRQHIGETWEVDLGSDVVYRIRVADVRMLAEPSLIGGTYIVGYFQLLLPKGVWSPWDYREVPFFTQLFEGVHLVEAAPRKSDDPGT